MLSPLIPLTLHRTSYVYLQCIAVVSHYDLCMYMLHAAYTTYVCVVYRASYGHFDSAVIISHVCTCVSMRCGFSHMYKCVCTYTYTLIHVCIC